MSRKKPRYDAIEYHLSCGHVLGMLGAAYLGKRMHNTLVCPKDDARMFIIHIVYEKSEENNESR